MKIHRLIGIITTLQQKKTVTAPYLAEKFEVSRRTIGTSRTSARQAFPWSLPREQAAASLSWKASLWTPLSSRNRNWRLISSTKFRNPL